MQGWNFNLDLFFLRFVLENGEVAHAAFMCSDKYYFSGSFLVILL